MSQGGRGDGRPARHPRQVPGRVRSCSSTGSSRDFNEFNLAVSRAGDVTLIDFPQMVSTAHPNAAMYFDCDVSGLVKYFKMKMKISVPDDELPTYGMLKLQEVSSPRPPSTPRWRRRRGGGGGRSGTSTASASGQREGGAAAREEEKEGKALALVLVLVLPGRRPKERRRRLRPPPPLAPGPLPVVRLDDIVRASAPGGSDKEITQFLELSREEEAACRRGRARGAGGTSTTTATTTTTTTMMTTTTTTTTRDEVAGGGDEEGGGDRCGFEKAAAGVREGATPWRANERWPLHEALREAPQRPRRRRRRRRGRRRRQEAGAFDDDDWMAAQSARGASHAASRRRCAQTGRTSGAHFHCGGGVRTPSLTPRAARRAAATAQTAVFRPQARSEEESWLRHLICFAPILQGGPGPVRSCYSFFPLLPRREQPPRRK